MSDLLHPSLSTHVLEYSQIPPLLYLEAPWPFVPIGHLDYCEEGAGVELKNKLVFECWLCCFYNSLWTWTMTLSSLSAKQSSYIYLPVLFVGRTWKKSWKSTSGCSQHTQLLSKSGWDYRELFPDQNLALSIAVRVFLRVQVLPCICRAPCHCLGAARLALLDGLWAKECMHL